MSDTGRLPSTIRFEAEKNLVSSQASPVAECESEPTRASGLSPIPESIGRYRIERVLGKGGFGLVYLGYDEQLQRPVAVKIPHADRISRPEDAARYLDEARLVAGLTHPHIVPVHDVGSSDQFPFYVVSKYIEGSTLSAAYWS
jgi:serine/threonine protein kinase